MGWAYPRVASAALPAVLGALFFCPQVIVAAEPEFLAATSKIDPQMLLQTRAVGNFGKTVFRDLCPKPGVLIGFDLGIGLFTKYEVIYSVRPIYLTADGEKRGKDHGSFAVGHSKVERVVTVKAKPGYAVGEMTARPGIQLEGLSIKFMRVDGCKLKPEDNYESDWIGNARSARSTSIGSSEGLIVGIHGKESEIDCKTLGFIYMAPPQLPPNLESAKPEGDPAKSGSAVPSTASGRETPPQSGPGQIAIPGFDTDAAADQSDPQLEIRVKPVVPVQVHLQPLEGPEDGTNATNWLMPALVGGAAAVFVGALWFFASALSAKALSPSEGDSQLPAPPPDEVYVLEIDDEAMAEETPSPSKTKNQLFENDAYNPLHKDWDVR